jgi:hypothetical protein
MAGHERVPAFKRRCYISRHGHSPWGPIPRVVIRGRHCSNSAGPQRGEVIAFEPREPCAVECEGVFRSVNPVQSAALPHPHRSRRPSRFGWDAFVSRRRDDAGSVVADRHEPENSLALPIEIAALHAIGHLRPKRPALNVETCVDTMDEDLAQGRTRLSVTPDLGEDPFPSFRERPISFARYFLTTIAPAHWRGHLADRLARPFQRGEFDAGGLQLAFNLRDFIARTHDKRIAGMSQRVYAIDYIRTLKRDAPICAQAGFFARPLNRRADG